MIAPIIAQSGREEEGAKTWRDLGFRETYGLWKEQTIRQPDGSYIVDSLSRSNVQHHVSFTLSSCDCEHFLYGKPDEEDNPPTCIHMMLAVKRDLEHRKEDAKRTEALREASLARSKERIRFTPEQVEANLARMGGVA